MFVHDFARGRRRPRFPALAAMALALSTLCACNAGSDLWGGLPLRLRMDAGADNVKIAVEQQGFGPANIAYCEMPSCPRPTVVATFAVRRRGEGLSLALADPKSLLKAERVKFATARDPSPRASPRRK